MSELLELDPLSAPSITQRQCLKRSAALSLSIDAGWEFISFMQKLDETMRLTFLNYLHTQSNSLEDAIALESEVEQPSSEIKTHTQSLSPKKRSTKSPSKKAFKKPSRATF